MPELVLVAAGIGVPFDVRLNSDFDPTSLSLRHENGGQFDFTLPQPLTIPPQLLTDGVAGTKRLLTFDEMRSAAVTAGAAIEDEWQAQLAKLSRIEVSLVRSEKGEALIGGVAVTPSSTTAVSAALRLNMRDAVMDGATLEAELRVDASCTVTVLQAQLVTVLSVLLQVSAAGPRLSFTLPEFPLRFPELSLPALDWLKLAKVEWTPIKLPAIPFLPVEVVASDVKFTGSASGSRLAYKFDIAKVDVGLHGKGTKTWLEDVAIEQTGGDLTVEFKALLPTIDLAGFEARLPSAGGPVRLSLDTGSKLDLRLHQSGSRTAILGCLVADLTLTSVTDASKKLRVKATVPFDGDKLVDQFDPGGGEQPMPRRFELEVSPNVFKDLALAVGDMPAGLALDLRFPEELLDAVATLAHLVAELLVAAGEALSGLAQMVHRVVQALVERVVDFVSTLDMTLVLNKRTGALQQVIFNIHRAQKKNDLDWDKLGFHVNVPADVDMALLLDFREGRRDAYFVVSAEAAAGLPIVEVGTDLWFSTPDTERPAGQLGPTGKQPPRLLQLKVVRNKPVAPRVSLVPFGIRDGRATFLHALEPALPKIGTGPSIETKGYELVDVPDVLDTNLNIDKEAAGKRLPFLSAPNDGSGGGEGMLSALKQYIEIEAPGNKFEVRDGVAHAPINARINALGGSFSTTLDLQVELRTLSARVSGGQVDISVNDKFDLFGMTGEFRKAGQKITEKQFVLDLKGSDSRLYLSDGVELFLDFKTVSTTPLRFKVSRFVMHGGGLDLEAELAGETKIPLNGLGTDFTFKTARLSVRNSRPSAFTLDAKGKLPPDLLGDVDSELHLSFGMRNGRFKLLDGSLELVNKGKPIRSEHTHFVFTLDGVAVRVFEDAGSLHFCAFVSGSAEFKPEAAELANGMFKKLAGVKLRFTDCPVCGASDVIERELQKLNLSFIVALDEPARANLFELFKLEVRSIGLEPRCRQFDDTPAALVIGGQVTFADTGDVVRAECDFHKIYIAPPAPEQFLPRIKCEGLGVGIRLGSAFAIEGKVVAVDGTMPETLVSIPPEDRLKGKGFMGQGRVAIEGLPPIAASFGFVEISKGDWSRRAWFVYLEAQHLSYHFQLGPVPVYLREVGLGLGYHFTYVGISEIDRAPSLPEILGKLDKIASTALEPSKVETWVADPEPGLTLVARAMLSMSSASAPSEPLVWKPEEEKELPNIVLLNVLMAMRNTTFMMTANAWLGWNYHDWDEKRKLGQNELVGKQGLTGYIVVVGSRSEFLARLKGNAGAEVGPRLAMPDTFKSALKEVEYDATLYIRPGLLHFELGWPNRIRWSKNIAGANLTVAGGAIFRVHDSSLLVGLNLEGQLSFSMSGSLDAGVVGISVSASVYAALAARIIGYLDAKKASESLYYSLFSLQVRIQFAVSAWLEIKAWMCKITIRASFSISLQVDVLAELAIRGDGSLGTRMRATIAISVFGRSLGLSIGLAMNPGIVDSAQARVSRFMQLGLVQEVPSVSPPLATQDARVQDAATTGQEKRDAQATAALANASHKDQLAPVPHEEVTAGKPADASERRPIGATDFQVIASYPLAMKDPDRKPSEWAYLTFLPIDATGEDKSSFYAAPEGTPPPAKEGDLSAQQVDHYVDFSNLKLQPGEVLEHWNGKNWVQVGNVAEIPTYVDWDKVLPYEESTREDGKAPLVDQGVATLKEMFFAAFRTIEEKKDGDKAPVVRYFEPAVRAKSQHMDSRATDRPEIERAHLEQQRAYAAAIHVDPADRRCNEARDFLMYKFISDLFAYAADGTVSSTAHVLDLRLTFRVQRKVLERFSGPKAGPVATVRKRVVVDGVTDHLPSAECALFNPPDTTFAQAKPEFEDIYSDCTEGKIKLDWTLNWDVPNTPAEDYLQYYEVRRWINVGTEEFESDAMPVIRADREFRKGNVRMIERGEWQFTDEFEDLDAGQKKKLQEAGGTAVIRYSITPVCVSNTRGRTCSSFVLRYGGWPALNAPKQAKATLRIDPAAATEAGRFGVELQMKVENTPVQRGVRQWEILLRPEQIVPAGQYGSDAEMQRSLGGWLASSSLAQPNDVSIPVKFPEAMPREGDIEFKLDSEAAGRIRAEFMDVANPRAWRIRARQIVVDADKRMGKGKDVILTSSPWTEVEIAVQLRHKSRKDDRTEYVSLRPPAFEYIRQARDAEANMLAAVPADGLAPVDSGRATLMVPDRDTPRSLLHPEFGAASCLTWNVVPPGLDGAAVVPWRMLAGFDVMRLDLDGAERIEPQDWRRAKRVTSAQLLDVDRVRLLPGEVGDAANWKAAYPSLTARRRAGGAWYSAAESYIEWPRSGHRLEAVPEPSSDLLTALLCKGAPNAIVVSIAWEPPPTPEDPDTELPKTPPDLKWRFALRSVPAKRIPWTFDEGANRLVFNGDPAKDAGSLRDALRQLEIRADADSAAKGIPVSHLRRWQLTLKAVLVKDKADHEIAKQTIPLNLDRCLHPVLESILVRMQRFERAPDDVALLDVDRRPPPALKAKTTEEFFGATQDDADPYGWVMLDRLGLGVTLRLFDPLHDAYVDRAALKEQFEKALKELRAEGMHLEALDQYLCVDWLLRPGQLLRPMPFDERPDQHGFVGGAAEISWLDDASLSMMRISVRPRIHKRHSYQVKKYNVEAAMKLGSGTFSAMLLEDGIVKENADRTGLEEMLRKAAARAAGPSASDEAIKGEEAVERVVLFRYTSTLEGVTANDHAPGRTEGDLADAFGRFPALPWKEGDDGIEVKKQIDRFWRLLLNVTPYDPKKKELKTPDWLGIPEWLKYNQRFFEHASGHPDAGGESYAYAATEATEPVLVAPDVYGRATVVLPEADGYAHQFAYAVKPQWRYRSVLESAGYTVMEEVKPADLLPPPPYVIGTVERTAPVLPPVLISLGIVGDRMWWESGGKLIVQAPDQDDPKGAVRLGSDAGVSAALLLPHHPERRLARTNLPAQRNLAHAGELYTQLSMPVDPKWCESILGHLPAVPPKLPHAEVSDDANSTTEELEKLAKADLPFERARMRLVSYLPHWYRSIAAVAAASGTEASVPAVAYLPESAARLVLTDRRAMKLSLVSLHPWTGRTTVDASGEQRVDLKTLPGPVPHGGMVLSIPLLRYRDTTDAVTAELWSGEISMVPDPGVAYQIDLVAPRRRGEPRDSVTPIARIVRSEIAKNASFRVMPISRDWQVRCEMRVSSSDRSLDVSLSPLGAPLGGPALDDVDVKGVERDANGALRAPGGWSFVWIAPLLDLLEGTDPSVLSQAARVFRAIGEDCIGVPDDETDIFDPLTPVQLARMRFTRPQTDAERDALTDALLEWQLMNAGERYGMVIAKHVRQKFLDDEGKYLWPFPDDKGELEIPWLPDGMPEPGSDVLGFQWLTSKRYLLPELMTREVYKQLLAVADPEGKKRIKQLWQAQKDRAVGMRRIVITALRGDAVPLQMLPIYLA